MSHHDERFFYEDVKQDSNMFLENEEHRWTWFQANNFKQGFLVMAKVEIWGHVSGIRYSIYHFWLTDSLLALQLFLGSLLHFWLANSLWHVNFFFDISTFFWFTNELFAYQLLLVGNSRLARQLSFDLPMHSCLVNSLLAS